MADAARARRLGKRIMAIVATELEHQVKDPRLAMVTVTGATVTADLRDAVVYYTVYGDEAAAAGSAAALASASGILRTAVGRQTGVKFTPTLTFKPDTVPEHSRHIEQLLVAARASDAAVAERAAGASFAGEADPYRQPRIPSVTEGEDLGGDDGASAGGAHPNGATDGYHREADAAEPDRLGAGRHDGTVGPGTGER
jgi:ribosome-binding factor A